MAKCDSRMCTQGSSCLHQSFLSEYWFLYPPGGSEHRSRPITRQIIPSMVIHLLQVRGPFWYHASNYILYPPNQVLNFAYSGSIAHDSSYNQSLYKKSRYLTLFWIHTFYDRICGQIAIWFDKIPFVLKCESNVDNFWSIVLNVNFPETGSLLDAGDVNFFIMSVVLGFIFFESKGNGFCLLFLDLHGIIMLRQMLLN